MGAVQLIGESSKKGIKKAEEYLATRGLSLFEGVGYVLYEEIDSHRKVSNSLVIRIVNPMGETVFLDTKDLSTGVYYKVSDKNLVYTPIYNLQSIVDVRVLTEGVLNAECINQFFDVVASASLRASLNSKTLHVVAMSVRECLYLAFDNDSAGVNGSKKVISFFKEFYPSIKVRVLDFPYNDLNDFLLKEGPINFKKVIGYQLRTTEGSLSDVNRSAGGFDL